jgi:hypothetical protein
MKHSEIMIQANFCLLVFWLRFFVVYIRDSSRCWLLCASMQYRRESQPTSLNTKVSAQDAPKADVYRVSALLERFFGRVNCIPPYAGRRDEKSATFHWRFWHQVPAELHQTNSRFFIECLVPADTSTKLGNVPMLGSNLAGFHPASPASDESLQRLPVIDRRALSLNIASREFEDGDDAILQQLQPQVLPSSSIERLPTDASAIAVANSMPTISREKQSSPHQITDSTGDGWMFALAAAQLSPQASDSLLGIYISDVSIDLDSTHAGPLQLVGSAMAVGPLPAAQKPSAASSPTHSIFCTPQRADDAMFEVACMSTISPGQVFYCRPRLSCEHCVPSVEAAAASSDAHQTCHASVNGLCVDAHFNFDPVLCSSQHWVIAFAVKISHSAIYNFYIPVFGTVMLIQSQVRVWRTSNRILHACSYPHSIHNLFLSIFSNHHSHQLATFASFDYANTAFALEMVSTSSIICLEMTRLSRSVLKSLLGNFEWFVEMF